MNPLDWRGPEFLLFYVVCAGLACLLVVSWRRVSEGGPAPRVNLSDPYLIAYLRGGPNEALRVASVALVDRGLLSAAGTSLETAKGAVELVRRPLERATLEHFLVSRQAATLFDDPSAKAAAAALAPDLERVGLLPDAELRRQRLGRALFVLALLLSLAFLKLAVALSRGRHNVLLLLLLAVAFAVLVVRLSFPRRTARGDALLADLRELFAGLKSRAVELQLQPGGATAEVALLMAVYGLAALPLPQWSYAKDLYPKASRASQSSSSCGSSCSSSCGSSGCGGGGGCGGGCGGCGG